MNRSEKYKALGKKIAKMTTMGASFEEVEVEMMKNGPHPFSIWKIAVEKFITLSPRKDKEDALNSHHINDGGYVNDMYQRHAQADFMMKATGAAW